MTKPLPNIPALTGLRFFAAFFILFAHATDWLGQFSDSQIRRNFTFVAMYGMPLFFVLSGFVIHYNYRRLFAERPMTRAVFEFAAARFARLFPLYFCLLLMAIVADEFVLKTLNQPDLAARILAHYLTLTQTWGYYVYGGRSIVYWLFSVSWSISTEMFFYLAYVPAVYALLRVKGVRYAFVATLLYSIVTVGILIWSRYELDAILDFAKTHVKNYVDIPTAFEHSFYRWLFYFSPYVRVLEFFMGCLTAHLFIVMRELPITPREASLGQTALAVSIGFLVVCGAFYQSWLRIDPVNLYVQHLALNFLCAPPIAIVMFCSCRYDNAVSKFLSLPFLVLLGDTSYSIYLVHTWTLRVFNHPPANLDWIWGLESVLRVVVAIAFTLVVSYATYRLIEVPSRVWLRKKLSGLIAAALGDSANSIAASDDLPVHALLLARRARKVVLAAILIPVSTVIAVQIAESDGARLELHRLWVGRRPEISIVSASYGLNCKAFPVPPPFPMVVSEGNSTAPLARACNLLQRCEYRVGVSALGDPANGCGKEFVVEYRCTGSASLKTAFVPAEADGRSVVLDCTGNESRNAAN